MMGQRNAKASLSLSHLSHPLRHTTDGNLCISPHFSASYCICFPWW